MLPPSYDQAPARCRHGCGRGLFQCCDAADTHSGTDRATHFRRCSNGDLPRYAFLVTLTQSSDLKSADNSQAHSNGDWFSLAQV